MAIISNFELLVKRIGPPNGPPIAAFRRLLQGYYLTISNPSDRVVTLRARAVIPAINSDGKNSPYTANERELVGGATPNHFYAYDRTGDSGTTAAPREILNSLGLQSSKPEAKTFQTGNIRVHCKQTGLLNIVPQPAAAASPNPEIEIRGYIKLVQVTLIRFVQVSGNIYQLIFDVPDPVDLLVTPEIRGTFLDDGFPASTTNLDFDQSNYALPTANGGALVNVSEVVNPFFFGKDVAIDPLPFPLPGGGGGGLNFENPGELLNPERLTGTLNVLGEFSLNDRAIKYIDSVLKKQKGIGYSLKAVKQNIERTINELSLTDEKEEKKLKKGKDK